MQAVNRVCFNSSGSGDPTYVSRMYGARGI